MKLAVVTLTLDEEVHIARALASVADLADEMIVVDSGSTDRTVEIADGAGARVVFNPWVNYSKQFNFALGCVPDDIDWVMRLDADEIVSDELAAEIRTLGTLGNDVDGVYVSRRMTFLRRPIRWGGIFPVRVIRLFRNGRALCEERWMDEHIRVGGGTADFEGEILDDNVKDLTWWTNKHNNYASREVIDLLNHEFRFMPQETVADLRGGQQAGVKRWIKERLYLRLPSGIRAFVYFVYRYFVRLGFLDGREGAAFHVLQGFWYRFLVDQKLFEVKRHMALNDTDAPAAIAAILGVHVRTDESS